METVADNRWSWAENIWRQAFARLEEAGYNLERVDRPDYWTLHEAELRRHFPPEVFFDIPGLRSPAEHAGQKRLDEVRGARPLEDYCIIRQGDALVGVFSGHQYERGAYRMYHSNIHPDFRGRGVYREILRGTIEYTQALGFDTIVSEHAPSNNPILIAKLKAGFRIVTMDIDPMAGVSIRLCYFHNPDHMAAYDYRCGRATITPRLLARGSGAMPLLVEQFASSPEPDDDAT